MLCKIKANMCLKKEWICYILAATVYQQRMGPSTDYLWKWNIETCKATFLTYLCEESYEHKFSNNTTVSNIIKYLYYWPLIVRITNVKLYSNNDLTYKSSTVTNLERAYNGHR